MQPQQDGDARSTGGTSCRVLCISAGDDRSIAASLGDRYRVEARQLSADTTVSIGSETDCLVLDAAAFRSINADKTASLPSVPTVVFSETADPALAQTVARCDGYDIVYGEEATESDAGSTAALERLSDRVDVACYEAARADHVEEGDDGDTDQGNEEPDTDEAAAADLGDTILGTTGVLMSAAPDEVDTRIEWGLRSIAGAIGADRGVVYEYDDEKLVPTHEWHDPELDALEHESVRADSFPGFEESVSQFEPFRRDRRESGSSGWVEGALSELGYDSEGVFIAVPIVVEWTLRRMLVVDGASPAALSETAASRLETAGELIGQTLRRNRRRREINRQNERLERFASVISHDLKNPLNVISGYSDLARESGELEHVDRIASAADRMEDILDDLRTLTREAEDLGELEPIAVADVVERAERAVETGRMHLETERVGTVEADPGRLQQGFENLLRNAVEHGFTDSDSQARQNSVEHGSTDSHSEADDTDDHVGKGLTVRLEPIEGGFALADNGCGFDPEDQGRLFEEGYTGGNGTGLGLAIVRTVIEAHGWEIEATNAESGGARFEVTGVRFCE